MSFFFLRPLFWFFAQKFAVFLLLLAPSFLSGFTKSFVVVICFFFFVGGGGAYLLSSYLLSLVHLC